MNFVLLLLIAIIAIATYFLGKTVGQVKIINCITDSLRDKELDNHSEEFVEGAIYVGNYILKRLLNKRN